MFSRMVYEYRKIYFTSAKYKGIFKMHFGYTLHIAYIYPDDTQIGLPQISEMDLFVIWMC